MRLLILIVIFSVSIFAVSLVASDTHLSNELSITVIDDILALLIILVFGLLLLSNYRLLKEIKRRKQIEISLIQTQSEIHKMATLKNNFVAQISHDIRTPMNLIVGYAELLQKTKLSKIQEHYTNQLMVGCGNLLGFIDEILDVSTIEHKRLTLDFQKTSIENIFVDLYTIFGFLAKAKSLNLHIVKEDVLPLFILCDTKKLTKILSNLLSNAIKYTQNGDITFKVTILHQTQTTVQLKFVVEDSGIGICSFEQKNIFDLFTKGVLNSPYGGHGLGLFIVKQYCDFLGWQIGLRSVLSKGTTFEIITNELQIASVYHEKYLLDLDRVVIANDFKDQLIRIVDELYEVVDFDKCAQLLVVLENISRQNNGCFHELHGEFKNAIKSFDVEKIGELVEFLKKFLQKSNDEKTI